MMKYNVVEADDNNWIELLEGPFSGIRYRYGKVEFNDPIEEGGDATCKFEFIVYDQRLVVQLSEDKDFHKVIGDVLIQLIEDQISKNEVVFTGGV